MAELLTEWLHPTEPDRAKLNKLCMQAFLWLPKDLAIDLSDTLAHEPGAESWKAILCKVRTHLLGKDDGFEPEDVVFFNTRKS